MLDDRTKNERGKTSDLGDLTFLPVTADLKRAFQQSRADFSKALGMNLPESWPKHPEAFDPGARQDDAPWTGYLFLQRDEIVGNGGFVGPPDHEGAVEIGYEIAPSFRNQGHATRAVRQLIELAFRTGATRVIAHSLASPNASNAVMEKAGMRHVATCSDPEVGWTWRYVIERVSPAEGSLGTPPRG